MGAGLPTLGGVLQRAWGAAITLTLGKPLQAQQTKGGKGFGSALSSKRGPGVAHHLGGPDQVLLYVLSGLRITLRVRHPPLPGDISDMHCSVLCKGMPPQCDLPGGDW